MAEFRVLLVWSRVVGCVDIVVLEKISIVGTISGRKDDCVEFGFAFSFERGDRQPSWAGTDDDNVSGFCQ